MGFVPPSQSKGVQSHPQFIFLGLQVLIKGFYFSLIFGSLIIFTYAEYVD